VQDFITLAMAYGWPNKTKLDEFKTEFHARWAGYATGSSLYYQGSNAHWWSSSLNSATSAYYLYLNTGTIYPQSHHNKYYGFSVRCVKDEVEGKNDN